VVSVAYGGSKVMEKGPLLAARNHTTGETRCDLVETLGSDLRRWKLNTGVGSSFLGWVGGATLFAALIGGSMARRPYSPPGDFWFGVLAGGVLGFIVMLFVWGLVIGPLTRSGPTRRLLSEIEEFVGAQLKAAQPAPAP
jgi:hypothetical protein